MTAEEPTVSVTLAGRAHPHTLQRALEGQAYWLAMRSLYLEPDTLHAAETVAQAYEAALREGGYGDLLDQVPTMRRNWV